MILPLTIETSIIDDGETVELVLMAGHTTIADVSVAVEEELEEGVRRLLARAVA